MHVRPIEPGHVAAGIDTPVDGAGGSNGIRWASWAAFLEAAAMSSVQPLIGGVEHMDARNRRIAGAVGMDADEQVGLGPRWRSAPVGCWRCRHSRVVRVMTTSMPRAAKASRSLRIRPTPIRSPWGCRGNAGRTTAPGFAFA